MSTKFGQVASLPEATRLSAVAMLVAETIAQARASLRAIRDNLKIGFVPTMGALHAGHRRLIEEARRNSGFVAVSIFVNPLQFDRKEDFERYARTLPDDLAMCEQAGADLVFAPTPEEIYPPDSVANGSTATFVEVMGLTDHFCGATRPGHFRGVTTIVSKLFHIIEPQLAFFGEKDVQQLAVIERMVRDLDFPICVVPVATVREPDGLAMSSRNARLNPQERETATCLYRALLRVQTSLASDEIASSYQDCATVLADARALLDHPGVRVDYFDLADPLTMAPVRKVAGDVRAMGAIWVGSTRLIDNVLCRFQPPR